MIIVVLLGEKKKYMRGNIGVIFREIGQVDIIKLQAHSLLDCISVGKLGSNVRR